MHHSTEVVTWRAMGVDSREERDEWETLNSMWTSVSCFPVQVLSRIRKMQALLAGASLRMPASQDAPLASDVRKSADAAVAAAAAPASTSAECDVCYSSEDVHELPSGCGHRICNACHQKEKPESVGRDGCARVIIEDSLAEFPFAPLFCSSSAASSAQSVARPFSHPRNKRKPNGSKLRTR
jgi:hypothetical protein